MNSTQVQQLRILAQAVAGDITNEEAAESLGKSIRQFERLRSSFVRLGPEAVLHGNTGRTPANKLESEKRDRILELVRGPYRGFNEHHLTEMLNEREDIAVSVSTVRRICRAANISSPRPHRRRRIHRMRRERSAREGMMLQMDGSPHAWFEGRGPKMTLVSAIDDATGYMWAVFREGETLEAYMSVMKIIAADKGLPGCIYTDMSAIVAGTNRRFKRVPSDENTGPTSQFSRVCSELEIAIILAHSAQAKGRTERSHGTHQDRLVSMFRLESITTLSEANRYLTSVYLPDHNRRFTVAASDPAPAWKAWNSPLAPDDVFCLKHERKVAKDSTVRCFDNLIAIPPGPHRESYIGQTVTVHRRYDLSVGVFHNNTFIGGQPSDSSRPPEMHVSPSTNRQNR